MFDFFGDVIFFFNQLIAIINWFFSVLSSFLHTFRQNGAVAQVLQTVSQLPPEITAIILFTLAMMIFGFIRGRKT